MNPPIGRRALGIALAASSVVGMAACSSEREAVSAPPFGSTPDTVPTGPLPPPRPLATTTAVPVDAVAMVGDSITVGSQDALVEGFASLGLDDVDIDARSGRRMLLGSSIDSGRDAIEAITGTESPDLWVIALGTNDVANYAPAEYGAVIDEVVSAIPSEAPLVWVDTYLDDYAERASEFNAVLRMVLAARGRATVVDWASIAAEDGVLTDGVHPSGYGVEEFTRRVVAAVDGWTA